MEIRRDAFQALADPTRREILLLLAGNSLNLNTIAGNFDMSRPAISQHIKILQECGLVYIRQSGRERHCEIAHDELQKVHQWLDQFKVFWNQKLDSLALHLESNKVTSKKSKKK